MAIKVNNQSIQKIMLGNIPVKRIYEDMQIVFDTGSAPQPCFEVVDIISQASGDYVDVYVNNEAKWYKRNNLNQYEEYGLMPVINSLSDVTYYVGKLVILSTDMHEYKWNGTTWVDLGECEDSYTEYEYLQGNGTSYILTDYIPKDNTRVEADISGFRSNGQIFGALNYWRSTGSAAKRCRVQFSGSTNIRYDFGENRIDLTQSGLSNRLSIKIDSTGGYLNGTKIANFTSSTSVTGCESVLGIFCAAAYDYTSNSQILQPNSVNYNGRMYSLKVYEGDTLIRNYVPAVKNGSIGMYDTLHGTLWSSYVLTQFNVGGSSEEHGLVPEDYDTKVAPANYVHYNTLEELELMECPWVGMIATIGQNNIYYEYTDEGWVLTEIPLNLPYLRFTTSQDSTFTFEDSGLKYSINGSPWRTLTANTPTGLVTAGSYIILKGTMSKTASQNGRRFTATGNFSASGNVMSLLYDDEFTDKTSLADTSNVFKNLFSGCNKLTSISSLSLPATTLGEYCYEAMFNATKITSIPSGFLPATTMTNGCYGSMFSSTDLTSIPSDLLPATTLALNCYSSMFSSCNNLTSIPSGLLPATTLVDGCYTSMFYYSTNLVSANIELPATTLTEYCYQSMFGSCSKLEEPPIIKATSATASHCMRNMFSGCSKMKYLVASILTEPSTSVTSAWMYGVSATGTFYKNPNATWDQTITRGADTVPSGWTIVDDHQGNVNYLKFTTVDDNGSTYKFNKPTEYSIDNGSWTALSASTNSPLVPKDHEIRFRSDYTPSGNNPQIIVTTSGKFIASGELMTLLYCDKYYGQTSKAIIRTFYQMFKGGNIVSAENLILPVFDLAPERVFQEMFMNCQYLTIAPNVRAKETRGYSFRDMFHNCYNLLTIQDVYCENTSTESHVSMFQDCTSITSIDFNITATFGWSIQSMCEGCTGLQSAIVRGNFANNYCANRLFKGCSTLNSVTYLGSTSPGTLARTNDWMDGVAATGTFYMDQAYSWDSTVPRTINGVPSGWTIVKIDPSSV